jgi:hypothetical protein
MNDDVWKQQLYSDDFLRIIAEEPHKLGWFIGKDKLIPLHSEWIRYCWDSNEPRALQAFRGGYKTTSVVVVGAIRWMLFHPDDRIAIIRKNFEGAANFTRAIASAMEMPEVKEVFKYAHGKTPKLIVQRNGSFRWSFKQTKTPEDNLTPLGIETAITGSHFDKVLCDDIITMTDRASNAEREKTKDVVHEVAANVIDPDKGSIWVGTPWHREDAWKEINRFCDIAKYPISKYNFLGKKELERRRLMTTPYLFAANNELELRKDESLLFSEPLWPRQWDHAIMGAMAQLDTAFDGDHYCALTIAAPTRKENGDQWYQAVGFTYPGNVEDWETTIATLCKKYRVKYIYVEINADKGASAKRLAAKGLRVKPYTEGMNKHIKIGTYLYAVWPHVEWSRDTDEEYMSQVTEYREGMTPDDAPDSAASLFREAFSGPSAARLARWE